MRRSDTCLGVYTRMFGMVLVFSSPQVVQVTTPSPPFYCRYPHVALRPRSYCMLPIKFRPEVPGTKCTTINVAASSIDPPERPHVVSGVPGGAVPHAGAADDDKVWRPATGHYPAASREHTGRRRASTVHTKKPRLAVVTSASVEVCGLATQQG